MSEWVAALGGLAAVALAMVGCSGYGRLLLPAGGEGEDASPGFGLSVTIGLSVFLAVCGVLERFALASPGFALTFLLIGCACQAWKAAPRPRGLAVPDRRDARSLGLIRSGPVLLALLGLLLIANAGAWSFQNMDDLHGYLVLYNRMIQLGAQGADPFLYRRFEAGLGGGLYVYLLHPWPGGSWNIRVMDIGLGLATLAALMIRDLRGSRRGWPLLAAGLLLLVSVAFAPSVNMTPEIVGMALFYGLLRASLLLAHGTAPWRRMLVLGLLVFGLACVKTTFLVPAVLVVVLGYGLLLLHDRNGRIVAEAVGAGLLCLALMGPWMAVSHAAVGTPFFPVLGIGRLSPVEVSGFASPADYLKAFVRIAVIMALPLWVGARLLPRAASPAARLEALLPFLLLLVFAALQAKYTVAGYRYGYASAAAVFLFYLVAWLRRPAGRLERSVMAAGLGAVALNMAAYFLLVPGYGADTFSGGFLYRRLVLPQAGTADEADRTRQVALRRMQAAIPAGAAFLARVDRPDLLDFRRNTIHAMDWPGLLGPPPGPPATDAVPDWTGYLRRSGLRYIAYSYADRAGTVSLGIEEQIARSDSAWQRTLLGRTHGVQTMLDALGRTERILFDDGARYVVDLGP